MHCYFHKVSSKSPEGTKKMIDPPTLCSLSQGTDPPGLGRDKPWKGEGLPRPCQDRLRLQPWDRLPRWKGKKWTTGLSWIIFIGRAQTFPLIVYDSFLCSCFPPLQCPLLLLPPMTGVWGGAALGQSPGHRQRWNGELWSSERPHKPSWFQWKTEVTQLRSLPYQCLRQTLWTCAVELGHDKKWFKHSSFSQGENCEGESPARDWELHVWRPRADPTGCHWMHVQLGLM